jgi:hypothetical protein
LDDIDLVGNDIHSFSRYWFADGLAKSLSHVLVEFPRSDGEFISKADENEANLRPYWVHIRPEQLIFADAEIVAGREVLREIRIMEALTEREGFAEVSRAQIRRLFMKDGTCYVELYQQRKDKKKGNKEAWVVVENYTTTLPYIPLVTFYSDRAGFMYGKSPAEDLVDLNIAHWQSTSDQRAVLTVARFPILACSGGIDENKIVIGPFQFLYCPDAQGRYYYVEHSGAAIAAGREDLTALETQMSEYGAEFLKKRPGVVTATARALDSAEATSGLQEVTRRFADAMSLALQYTAEWLHLASGGTATLSTDFGPEVSDPSELQTLTATRAAKDISRRAWLEELKRRGMLSDEYDIDEDALQLEKESMDMFGGEMPKPVVTVQGGEEGAV